MCGRFTRSYTWRDVRDFLDLKFPAPEEMLSPSYNVAPTQRVPVCRIGEGGERELVPMKWGLVPSWAKDEKIGNSLINARADTAATKPSFRSAFKRRRCLVPASGFFEWQKIEGEKTKQPWYFTVTDAPLFAFAGLWERWKHDDDTLDSFTLMTTTPNALVARVHDRMPVILSRENSARWIGTEEIDAAEATALLAPYPAERMAAQRVGSRVNSPKNNDPAILDSL